MTAKLAEPGLKGKADTPMGLALAEAEAAAARGEVPIGAVVVDADGKVLAKAGNRTLELRDPTAHVTLESCAMCAAAISFARIRRLYFGANDPKGGAVEHGPRFFQRATCHHAPDVYGGIGEARAAALLKDFFAARR
jgi:tRNA(adenine34) deaminase